MDSFRLYTAAVITLQLTILSTSQSPYPAERSFGMLHPHFTSSQQYHLSHSADLRTQSLVNFYSLERSDDYKDEDGLKLSSSLDLSTHVLQPLYVPIAIYLNTYLDVDAPLPVDQFTAEGTKLGVVDRSDT